METTAVARSMRGSIGMLAMAWLMADSTRAQAVERGLPAGNAAYAVGRLGVLGDCPVDNVVGAAFFWEPDLMRSMVAEGRATTTPARGAAVYTEICRRWGEQHLAGFDGTERLGELCERVVDAASPLGAPLFVGWRDRPRPEAGAARTFQLCQVMRELRFGRHVVAVQAAGMSPLEAILSGPAGEWNAEFFGWQRPYPDVSTLVDARAEIEDATDRLHAPDFEVLTPDERAELRVLAKAARALGEQNQNV
ncbi:SCO6745 family protein [Ilumatobacter sp.]|uniref:SCO6745 family protein n=1 Tax=Ilumatobacter sp. TaxID=1967498 RepID=UPI003AF59C96